MATHGASILLKSLEFSRVVKQKKSINYDCYGATVQVKKNPHFLFFSMISCLFFWEKLGEIVENFSRFLQEIQYFLQEIPVFLPEILRFCL